MYLQQRIKKVKRHNICVILATETMTDVLSLSKGVVVRRAKITIIDPDLLTDTTALDKQCDNILGLKL